MPTKARVKKEKEAKLAYEKQVGQLGEIPDYLKKTSLTNLGNSLALGIDGKSTIYDGGLVVFDENGEGFLHPHHGKNAQEYNQKMSRDRVQNAKDLKRKYPDKWGVRGAAKCISIDEELSVRTVQKYFKDFP